MKKMGVILLTLCMTISLAACAGNSPQAKTGSLDTSDTAVKGINESEESADSETKNGNEQTDETAAEPDTGTVDTNILVTYFSATGTTKGVAQTIADTLGADLYEIVPAEPYTEADLNYNDDHSRSTVEMNDPSARPAISGSVENMEQYDIVFVGYPIWWYDAPRIMSTFMESYDFSGKTIVPFCTSGGSGIGSSGENLEALTDGARWLSGQRLNSGSSGEEIAEWIESLGLNG